MRDRHAIWSTLVALVWLLAAGAGCVPSKDVKAGADAKANATKKVAASGQSSCIKGRVVGEDGKGIPYVLVQTKPNTTPAITDQNGHYEFCYLRNNTDGSVESTRHPIPKRKYQILAKKNGFVARPIEVDYKGQAIKTSSIQLLEKQFKPGGEVQTKGKDKQHGKLPSGITGSHPKGG